MTDYKELHTKLVVLGEKYEKEGTFDISDAFDLLVSYDTELEKCELGSDK